MRVIVSSTQKIDEWVCENHKNDLFRSLVTKRYSFINRRTLLFHSNNGSA